MGKQRPMQLRHARKLMVGGKVYTVTPLYGATGLSWEVVRDDDGFRVGERRTLPQARILATQNAGGGVLTEEVVKPAGESGPRAVRARDGRVGRKVFKLR